MVFDLTLEHATPEQLGTKNIVFLILNEKFPLSIAELNREIETQFNVKLSYQAVRKAVGSLLEQSILERDEKKFRVSKHWLLKTKETVDQLLLKYEGDQIHFDADDDYARYTISSLFEADNFWGDILVRVADLARSVSQMEITCFWHYAWWMVINLGRETQLFDNFIKAEHICKQYVFRDLPLNRWAADIYNSMNVKTILHEHTESNELVAFNIVGDYVIQVEFPEVAVLAIRKLFEEHEHIQEVDRSALNELAHFPHQIKFTVFRNSLIADNLKSTLGQDFID